MNRNREVARVRAALNYKLQVRVCKHCGSYGDLRSHGDRHSQRPWCAQFDFATRTDHVCDEWHAK